MMGGEDILSSPLAVWIRASSFRASRSPLFSISFQTQSLEGSTAQALPVAGNFEQGSYFLPAGHSLRGQMPPVKLMTQCPQFVHWLRATGSSCHHQGVALRDGFPVYPHRLSHYLLRTAGGDALREQHLLAPIPEDALDESQPLAPAGPAQIGAYPAGKDADLLGILQREPQLLSRLPTRLVHLSPCLWSPPCRPPGTGSG